MAGWVRLHRKSMKSRVWASDGLWKVWCYCLMRANHNDQIVPVQTGRGLTEVAVKRGQFIYGRKAAAKVLRCPESTCHERMKKLAKLQNITLEPGTHYTLVTVCAFERYNHPPTTNLAPNPTTNQQPTNNQPDTDKNVIKEVKKNDKEVSRAFRPPSVLEVAAYCRERSNRVDAQQFVDHYTSNGWRVGKNPMKDWRASVRTWEKNQHSGGTHASRNPIPAGPGQKYDGQPLGKF